MPDPPLVAFLGVRGCEIAALRTQDAVLAAGPAVDRDYVARRGSSLVIAVECEVPASTCFCTSMGTGPEVTTGFDLALTELDDGFVVRSGSPAGERLVDRLALGPAAGAQQDDARAAVAAARALIGDPVPTAGLPARLVAAAGSPRWAEIAERCLACANCTLVCPTCFCTGVSQVSDLDGVESVAERTWDSCFTLGFAKVAGGNFRPRTQDRYRQWLTHKFGTWWDQFGMSGCVGCGRCITWCPVGIDVRDELLAVAPPPLDVPPPATATVAPRPMVPAVGRPLPVIEALPPTYARAFVVEHRRETHDVVTLRLEVDDPALRGGRPGQFVMAALPAFSAAPISVSRFLPDGLELTIRGAGAATRALCGLRRGDSLGVRGPLGRGWPVDGRLRPRRRHRHRRHRSRARSARWSTRSSPSATNSGPSGSCTARGPPAIACSSMSSRRSAGGPTSTSARPSTGPAPSGSVASGSSPSCSTGRAGTGRARPRSSAVRNG